jgi:hypothetical protein
MEVTPMADSITAEQTLPPGYIDPEHSGADRKLLEVFYAACNSEGGTADEIHLRGIRAVLAAQPAPPAEGEVSDAELLALKSWSGSTAFESDLVDICRAAIALDRSRRAPVPPAEGEVTDEGLHALWDTGFEGDFQDCRRFFHEAVEHFALSRAPVQVADGEVAKLVAWLKETGRELSSDLIGDAVDPLAAERFFRIAALLQHHQPPQPVAVSERPWERDGWVNGDDECWIGYPSTTYAIADTGDYDTTACEWRLEAPPSRPELSNCVALPFHALPIPTTPPEAP